MQRKTASKRGPSSPAQPRRAAGTQHCLGGAPMAEATLPSTSHVSNCVQRLSPCFRNQGVFPLLQQTMKLIFKVHLLSPALTRHHLSRAQPLLRSGRERLLCTARQKPQCSPRSSFLYMDGGLAACLSAHPVHMVPRALGRGHCSPRNYTYRWLEAATWALGRAV